MKTPVCALAGIALLACAAPLRAATVPVTVTIDSVWNISAGDVGGPPDFYARIWIDGAVMRTPTVFDSNGFTGPAGWTFTRQISRAKRGGVTPIRIEVFDYDHPLSDPLVDIDPATCSGDPFGYGCAELSVGGVQPVDGLGIDVNLNLFDGSWSPVNAAGDSTMGPASSANPQRACTTGAGSNVANICFTISVGPPKREILTVSKTTDSNRPSCVPGDCALREAVNRAENGDTISLPASATPYLLQGQEAIGHLAIRRPPHLPASSTPAEHVVRIEGPRTGGTAVIRQTLGDFRVFDVHAGAKLVMSHVTVTGGSAGNTSTAYPGHIHGGGIHNHGTVELTRVTLTGNYANEPSDTVGGGGGIYSASGAAVKLTNVTIAGNSAATANGVPLGGGIGGPGPYTLRNTVIANNTVNGGGASNCGVGGGIGKSMNIANDGGSLQFPGDCGAWVPFYTRTGTWPVWLPAMPVANSDPLLPYDATRGIFLPVPQGPGVDTGVSGCTATDQAGRPAPRDGDGDGIVVCDAGSIEAQ